MIAAVLGYVIGLDQHREVLFSHGMTIQVSNIVHIALSRMRTSAEKFPRIILKGRQ